MWSQCNVSRRNSSRYGLTLFFRKLRPRRPRCCNKHEPSLSFFALVSDPVGSGFVASYRRPGGNVTGFDVSEPTQAGKWVELLKEITPRVARLAMLYNPENRQLMPNFG